MTWYLLVFLCVLGEEGCLFLLGGFYFVLLFFVCLFLVFSLDIPIHP